METLLVINNLGQQAGLRWNIKLLYVGTEDDNNLLGSLGEGSKPLPVTTSEATPKSSQAAVC